MLFNETKDKMQKYLFTIVFIAVQVQFKAQWKTAEYRGMLQEASSQFLTGGQRIP